MTESLQRIAVLYALQGHLLMSYHIFVKIKLTEVVYGVTQETIVFLNKEQESAKIFYLFWMYQVDFQSVMLPYKIPSKLLRISDMLNR